MIANERLKNRKLYLVSKRTGKQIRLKGKAQNDKLLFNVDISGGGFKFFAIR